MLALDLGVLQKTPHFPKMREALLWSIIWVALSLLFNSYIWYSLGSVKALEFFTGYVIEKALSVDNIFVFILIFSYFKVPYELQHKVLFWGVLGAVFFRTIFIVLGAALISQFHWILYLFGAFLVFTAIKLVLQKGEPDVDPEKNPFVRFFMRFYPMTTSYDDKTFFVRRDGVLMMTPLFLVIVMIESTDIAFAADSIPAIFAITQDSFIVYTSNIFAILGLRALYFVLANFMKKFHYLQMGLSIILGFIGIKMLVEPWIHISIVTSLLVIFGVLIASVVASVIRLKREERSMTL